MDVLDAAQDRIHLSLHRRIEVHRIEDLSVAAPAYLRQSAADAGNAAVVILAPMASHQDQAPAVVQEGKTGFHLAAEMLVGAEALLHDVKRVDDGVAGDEIRSAPSLRSGCPGTGRLERSEWTRGDR